jgi:hypothetical protein
MKTLLTVLLLSMSSLAMADYINRYEGLPVKRCQGDRYWEKTKAEQDKQRDPNYNCNQIQNQNPDPEYPRGVPSIQNGRLVLYPR